MRISPHSDGEEINLGNEGSLRCLTISALLNADGDIDGGELEAYLNKVAGPHQWLSTTEWLFAEPPSEAKEQKTVPVIMPEDVAVRAILSDLTNSQKRVVFDLPATAAEIRKWRWVAFQMAPNAQGQGRFPWEFLDA